MDVHAPRLLAAPEGLHNLCPQGTQGPQLGNLQEEIGPHGEAEDNLPGGLLNGQPPVQQSPQIGHCHGEGIGCLLHIIAATPAEHIAADKDRLQSRRMLASPSGSLCHFVIKPLQLGRQLALLCQLSQGICSYKALELSYIRTRGLQGPGHQGEHGQSRCPCVDIQGIFIQFQPLKEGMHIIQSSEGYALVTGSFGLAHIPGGESRPVQADIVDRGALLLLMPQQLVVLLGQGFVAALGNAPGLAHIAAGLRPPEVIPHAREFPLGQDILRILAEIHGVEGDALIGLGIHLLVEGRSLQERDAGFLPFLISGRGELVQGHIGKIRLLLGLLQDSLKVKLAAFFQLIAHTAASFVLVETEKATHLQARRRIA